MVSYRCSLLFTVVKWGAIVLSVLAHGQGFFYAGTLCWDKETINREAERYGDYDCAKDNTDSKVFTDF